MKEFRVVYSLSETLRGVCFVRAESPEMAAEKFSLLCCGARIVRVSAENTTRHWYEDAKR